MTREDISLGEFVKQLTVRIHKRDWPMPFKDEGQWHMLACSTLVNRSAGGAAPPEIRSTPQRLKPKVIAGLTARLKSCPSRSWWFRTRGLTPTSFPAVDAVTRIARRP